MNEQIKEELENMLAHLYNDEFNFNNADPTSGQRCYDEAQLKELIKQVAKEW